MSAEAVLAVVIIVLVAAVAAAVVLTVVRRRRRAEEARVFQRHLGELVSRVQWVYDEGSLEVLGASAAPERLQVVWRDTQSRIDDAVGRASELTMDTRDPLVSRELRDLGHALGRLAGAMETHVSLHTQLAGDATVESALVGASETVMDRRGELARAIGPLADRL